MNKLVSGVTLSLLMLSGTAMAQGNHYADWAQVVNVKPNYQQVRVPRQHCTSETVYDDRGYGDTDRDIGGAVIGGLAGGILGNQVGKGNGRTAATAVGAVVGALVGDRIDNDGYREARSDYRYGREVRHCQNIDQWENRINGYEVTYKYFGRHYKMVMPRDPGNRVRVNVSVSPQ